MEKRMLRWGRGQKTVRNLAAVLLVLGLCRGLLHFPMWLLVEKVRDRTAEQGVLTEDLVILWRGNLPCPPMGGGGAPLPGMDAVPVVLARGGGFLWSGYMATYEGNAYLSSIFCEPQPEGPALIACLPLYDHVPAVPGTTALLTAVNLPEKAKEGRVMIEMNGGSMRLAKSGREGDVIHFLVPGEEPWGRERGKMLSRAPYTLVLLDENGVVLAEARGTLPDLESTV